jgi:P-type Ca2+ transporter type 2C
MIIKKKKPKKEAEVLKEQFQTKTIQETYESLKTSPQGLSNSEAQKRALLFGKNLLHEEKISLLKFFFRQFNNLVIYILMAASIISISIGQWTDFFVIILIITINGSIGFWQEIKAEASIAALKKLTESRNKVIREDNLCIVSSSEVVPGDFLVIHEGELIPADIRLVESLGLMIDESTITGESFPVTKDPHLVLPKTAATYELTNMLLAGTSVVRGTGKGIVVNTGHNTYLASLAEKGKEASPKTPLIKALSFFTRRSLSLLLVLFAFLAIVGYFQGRSFLDLSYILLTTLVSAVPEGLPIVITLVMVLGAIALSKKKALVRYLPSVETLGSVTVIASDKTGTITQGRLIVKEVFAPHLEKLKLVAALCNDAHENSGDPIDVALSLWVEDWEELRRQHPRKWSFSFESRQMFMATVHDHELFIKGAFEVLKEKSQNLEELKEFEKVFHSFLQKGFRVLAFGIGKWENKDPSLWKIQMIGLIGFLDPPKEGVQESVEAAKKAGIRVVMLTGDHPTTAKVIAKEVGIFSDKDSSLSGKEIEKLSDTQLLESLKTSTVLARILPEYKYRAVKVLQESGEIVAVTGDGINDIPALKAADIGIAMGSGAEAAKNVAKMILVDNNLKVIVDAIKIARIIADNIRKTIYYLTATGLLEITLVFLAILSFLPLPLSAIQILWLNLVTAGVQDKTFSFAKEEGDVMSRKPRKPKTQFFGKEQILKILCYGIPMGTLCFFLYHYLLKIYSFEITSTILFTSIVMAEWANGIQSQKESEPFFKHLRNSFHINPYIFFALGVGLILHCFAIYVLPTTFHSVPLQAEHWIYPISIFFIVFSFLEMTKWIRVFYQYFSLKKKS